MRSGIDPLEALKMLIELKHTTIVESDTLEHPITIEQPMIKDRHFRIRTINDLAIQIDLHGIQSLCSP